MITIEEILERHLLMRKIFNENNSYSIEIKICFREDERRYK